MTDQLAVGVIGAGAAGRRHAKALAMLPNARLAGIYDIIPERAGVLSLELGVPAATSLNDLLNRCDAVTVAVPTAAHVEVGLQAILNDVAVLMEKPLAANEADAEAILAAAVRRGVPLQVGHVERFNPVVTAAKQYLNDPRYLELTRLASYQPRGTDIPVVLDLMIHDLDLLLHLTGYPTLHSVQASGVAVLSDSLDMVAARLEFTDGLVAQVSASRLAKTKIRSCRVFQPSGYLSLDLASSRGEFWRLKEGFRPGGETGIDDAIDRVVLEPAPIDAMQQELASFVDHVTSGVPSGVTGSEALEALRIALKVIESVQSVSLTQIPR